MRFAVTTSKPAQAHLLEGSLMSEEATAALFDAVLSDYDAVIVLHHDALPHAGIAIQDSGLIARCCLYLHQFLVHFLVHVNAHIPFCRRQAQ